MHHINDVFLLIFRGQFEHGRVSGLSFVIFSATQPLFHAEKMSVVFPRNNLSILLSLIFPFSVPFKNMNRRGCMMLVEAIIEVTVYPVSITRAQTSFLRSWYRCTPFIQPTKSPLDICAQARSCHAANPRQSLVAESAPSQPF